MANIDRLSALLNRFELSIAPAALCDASLMIFRGENHSVDRVVFCADPLTKSQSGTCLFAAKVDWSAGANPLLQALPCAVEMNVAEDPEALALVSLILSEDQAKRCGAGSVLNRLCEVLLVRLLRFQIEQGATKAGLIAGLADPRLSRAIVAMHDKPGRQWTSEDLAVEAGLSLSRFSELFQTVVGESPMAYLRRWRLAIARRDLARGDRIEQVARRYGYGSPEGFSRAFRKTYGQAPSALRSRAA